MAAPEGEHRTPENDFSLMLELERINQDENPIEREQKLNQFCEALDLQEADNEPSHEQGADPTPRT